MVSLSRRSSASSASDNSQPELFEDALENPASAHFSAKEEARLLAESNAIKNDANLHFAHGEYSQAIGTYDRALASCPNYLDYDIAVLKSNIAACHVKLEDWKAAVKSATDGLSSLDRAAGIVPAKEPDKSRLAGGNGNASRGKPTSVKPEPEDGQVIELDEGDDEETQLASLRLSDERKAQIGKLRTKLLLRRAKGNQEQNGWATLAAAEADYKDLMENAAYLPDRDRRFVRVQLSTLPARVKEAQEREVGEMMGKLKDLGNTFLKPFGLSTDNFNMVKDEKTGGYSMNFQNGSKR